MAGAPCSGSVLTGKERIDQALDDQVGLLVGRQLAVIQDQVEMGFAVRMAAMDLLARNLRMARSA